MSTFPQTDWLRLAVLREGSEEDRRAALGELYVRYRHPILGFLKGKGYAPDQAEDMVQSFFLYSMEHRLFEKADAERGRFRNLMLAALNNFAAKAHRADHAQKRQPAGGFESADELGPGDEAAQSGVDSNNPERLFLRDWAETLIRRVLAALEAEYSAPARRVHFEIFRQLLIAPILEGAEPPSQRALAAELGLTEKEVGNRLLTARRAYQRLLRAEVALYARSEDEVESEIRDLLAQLSPS